MSRPLYTFPPQPQLLPEQPIPSRVLRPDVGYGVGLRQPIQQGERKNLLTNCYPDEQGGSFTISLGKRPIASVAQQAAAGFVDAPIVAELTFGVGGAASIGVELDWLQGTLITVPCGGIGLNGFYPRMGLAKPFDYELTAIIMPGTRPPSAGVVPMARRTLRLDTIGAGVTTAAIAVPARGQSAFLLLPDPLAYGNLVITWDSQDTMSSAAFVANPLSRARPGGEEELAVPNGAASFTVENLLATSIAPIVVFGLAL